MAKYKVTIEEIFRTQVEIECNSTDIDEIIDSVNAGVFRNAADWTLDERNVRSVWDENNTLIYED